MDGTELAARFSYITNSLGFCGPQEAHTQFIEYISLKGNKEHVRNSIKKFEGLYPYLSSIAEKNGKDFLDFEVVEAYWIGNELLEAFSDDDLKSIIKKLVLRGLPKSIAKELIEKMPTGFLPHHNFNVFYVGVGRTTGSVETNLRNMDNCRTAWGKVTSIMGDKLVVSTQKLAKENGKFLLKDDVKTAVFIKDMLKDLKENDVVALHWGFAPLVLSQAQVKNLEKYTKLVIDVMNKLA